MVNTVAASEHYLELLRRSQRDLARLMVAGERPDPAALAGHEFRGTNTPATSRLIGIRRFVKGFRAGPDGRVAGYNRRVKGADLTTPWTTTAFRGHDEFGFFTVEAVDAEARDNRLLNALLLDYGAAHNPMWDISRLLRDYLVRVDPGSDELLLGQAYAAVGPARVRIGHFALEPIS